uniref:Uncharacterized protein n=1 Tax=Physcomitrium patens TaxID=3218 RepID=A0A2K1L2A9_PHYPA|nr:hypothetical protein PHYPA_002958 [Physcomitrium patens]
MTGPRPMMPYPRCLPFSEFATVRGGTTDLAALVVVSIVLSEVQNSGRYIIVLSGCHGDTAS